MIKTGRGSPPHTIFLVCLQGLGGSPLVPGRRWTKLADSGKLAVAGFLNKKTSGSAMLSRCSAGVTDEVEAKVVARVKRLRGKKWCVNRRCIGSIAQKIARTLKPEGIVMKTRLKFGRKWIRGVTKRHGLARRAVTKQSMLST